MQRHLTLQHLKDYIPSSRDHITKHRPDCFYVPRPPARRKYETAIRPPDRNFFKLMASLDAYMWVVVKKNVRSDKQMYDKIYECYKSVKSLTGYEQLPICQTFEQCMYWIQNFPSQVVLFQDLFTQLFQKLNCQQNTCGFHIISPSDVDIAKAARHNRKIKNIYDDQTEILKIVKQNMQRLAIKKQADDRKEEEKAFESQRLYIRNIIFPNFIKLSKHQKAQHKQYRLDLIGLRKLTQGDKLASKDKFIEYSRQKFPEDYQLIQQYNSNSFEVSKEILRFYTLDSFFYRIINNTLRIAKSTQEFFSIGQPFNKVFDAIKHQYDKSQKNESLIVYRGADLTNSQCQYLQQNIGRYIQINGFISTSKSFQTAKSFAKDRKSTTIFKIKFRKPLQKYKAFDYGYVDLQLNKCSAYDEDQVLFNALNVFKIIGKESKQGFNLYVLQYGAIFHILDEDPNKLQQNDKFAYYSFRELREMNQQVKDIGDVYLKTLQPERAIQIYQFKLQKLKQSLDTAKSQEYEETLIKAADAYLANGEPDKALKYYESTFKTKKKKKLFRRNTFDTAATQKLQTTQIITISTMLSSIQTNTDQFQKAQEQYNETVSEINEKLKTDWDMDIFWKKIDNSNIIVGSKRSQMLFQEEYNLLKDIKDELQEALKKIKGQPNQAYEKRKIQIKLTEIFVAMAESSSHSETAKERIPKIKSQFDQVFAKLSPVVQKDSYEQGLINSRKTQILRRTSKSNQQVDLETLKSNISKVVKHTSQTDQQLPQLYKSLAETFKSLKNPDFAGAIEASRKQQKHQTLIYGQSDPRPLNTKMKIAMIQRDDKNTVQALQQFAQAYHTQVYKTQTKFTVHAKILFNMSQAYTDKGQDGLALKSLQQAYDILQKQLSKKDFSKSVLRFKIRLRMGRIYTSTSLRSEGKLKIAETYLMEYHSFITKFYNYPHTDVAMSYNCLGALYSVIRKFDLSKKQFTLAIEIYCETSGTQSVEVARMKSNLAVCYAHLKDIRTATQMLLESRNIFQKIYKDLRKQNPFEHQSMFIQAEIQSLAKKYRQAIQSCEMSKQLQREFLESKKRFQNFAFLKSEFVSPTRNQSFFPKMGNNTQQVRSGIVKLGSESKTDNFNSIIAFKQKSENYGPMNSLISYITQHGFKCEFHICECLIYLKEYKQALVRLESLKDRLIDRIGKESINPLFKDTVFSKKKLYLSKSKEYIEKIGKLLERKGKQQGEGKSGQNDENSKEQLQGQQMIDHFT